MKKDFILAVSTLVLITALLTGCKKEGDLSASSGETSDLQVGNNSSCKLTHNAWSYIFTWDFHYNDKGLADEWKIDYNNGYVENYELEYDKFNRLIEATAYDASGNKIIITSFTYTGNRLTKQSWTDILFGTTRETLFSYNSKGQIVREDGSDDTHEFQTYDNMGNCTRSDYYIGSDLYFSDIYEFDSEVRNPLLTVSGVDFMFPYLGVGYFNKLWFSRNLSIIYDIDGNPYVINDLRASKTDFNTGFQNFPVAVNYYDETSASAFDFTFGYSCNGNNNNISDQNPSQRNTVATNKTFAHVGPMLNSGSGKSIKQQLQELRKQYSEQ